MPMGGCPMFANQTAKNPSLQIIHRGKTKSNKDIINNLSRLIFLNSNKILFFQRRIKEKYSNNTQFI